MFHQKILDVYCRHIDALGQTIYPDFEKVLTSLADYPAHQLKAETLYSTPRWKIIDRPMSHIDLALVLLPPDNSGIQASGWVICREDHMLRRLTFHDDADAVIETFRQAEAQSPLAMYQALDSVCDLVMDDRALSLFEILKQHHEGYVKSFTQALKDLPKPLLETACHAFKTREDMLHRILLTILTQSLYLDEEISTTQEVAPNLYNWLVCPHDAVDYTRKLLALSLEPTFISQIALGIPQSLKEDPTYHHGQPIHYLNHLLMGVDMGVMDAIHRVKAEMTTEHWEWVQAATAEDGLIA